MWCAYWDDIFIVIRMKKDTTIRSYLVLFGFKIVQLEMQQIHQSHTYLANALKVI